jgi:hypothetical protein
MIDMATIYIYLPRELMEFINNDYHNLCISSIEVENELVVIHDRRNKRDDYYQFSDGELSIKIEAHDN